MSVEDRIESAFAEVTFDTPIVEVRRRRRGPVRRHAALLLVAGAVAVVAFIGALVLPGRSGTESAARLDAGCRRQWAGPGPMPPFVVGAEGLRVYASGDVTFYCVPGSPGRVGEDSNPSVRSEAPDGPTPEVVAIALGRRTVVYGGTVPPGTDRVEVAQTGGPVWVGRLVGEHFVVSLPANVAYSYTVYLSARLGDEVAVVPGPILHSSPAPMFGPEECAAAASEMASVPMVTALGPLPTPTLAMRRLGRAPAGYQPDEVDLLAAPGVTAICRDGSPVAYFGTPAPGAVYGEVDPGAWALAGMIQPGVTSVAVTLSDGSKVPASLSGGWWLAWDARDQTGLTPPDTVPVTVVANTAAGPRVIWNR